MEQITDGLWATTHQVRLPGGFYFDSRMSVIDVGDGELLIHSPVPIDDELRREIDNFGIVRWIVAPNDMHHLYLPQASSLYPNAEVWGPAGARKKQSGVEFHGALEESFPDDWSDRMEAVHVHGTRGWAETVFFLPDRQTLLCTDLVFNIHDTVNRRTRWFLQLDRAYGELSQGITIRWLFTRDKAAVGDAFSRILSWDFDRIVMGHGDVLDHGGRTALAPQMDWALTTPVAALTA